MTDSTGHKEPDMAFHELMDWYDRGYQAGDEDVVEEIEQYAEVSLRLIERVRVRDQLPPPRLPNHQDFSRNPMESFTGLYEDHAAWFVGYSDGLHVAEVAAGLPCDDPGCRLCRRGSGGEFRRGIGSADVFDPGYGRRSLVYECSLWIRKDLRWK